MLLVEDVEPLTIAGRQYA